MRQTTLYLRFPELNPAGETSQNVTVHVLDSTQFDYTFLISLLKGVKFSDFGSLEFLKFMFQRMFLSCRVEVGRGMS